MDTDITIDRFTVHYIDRSNKRYERAKCVLRDTQAELNESVSKFLHKLISDVWDAEESGKINSARFSEPPNDFVAKIVAQMSQPLSDAEFLNESIRLSDCLNEKTPGSASPGLFGVFRLVQKPKDKRKKERVYIALLKIQAKNESFIKLKSAAITQMTIGAIKNLLLDKIQKGAIYPHPNKENYDLKVVDKQTPDEPAIYFSKHFLGCEVKRSDDIQVHSLISELESYARTRKLPFSNKNVPGLIKHLITQKHDVTTASLANNLDTLAFFGKDFKKNDFVSFIAKDSKLGPLDIPIQYFEEHPGTKPKQRMLGLKFNDPKYLGIEISGPLDLINSLLTFQDGFVTFSIRTNQNGFRIEWK
ncbi:MAG TPA: nucleoid-associated protein [Anaerolineales bacterium]|nr:nucleoid-associated protein [Anaerolineales bacterium]HLO33896.1 nucleoid-associated protein [Anaerolineales bacterium]